MKAFLIVAMVLSASAVEAQTATPMSEAQLRAAIAVIEDEKNAAENRAVSTLMQLEVVTKERDALKAAAGNPALKDDKK